MLFEKHCRQEGQMLEVTVFLQLIRRELHLFEHFSVGRAVLPLEGAVLPYRFEKQFVRMLGVKRIR